VGSKPALLLWDKQFISKQFYVGDIRETANQEIGVPGRAGIIKPCKNG
jgi:hypothetical protein